MNTIWIEQFFTRLIAERDGVSPEEVTLEYIREKRRQQRESEPPVTYRQADGLIYMSLSYERQLSQRMDRAHAAVVHT